MAVFYTRDRRVFRCGRGNTQDEVRFYRNLALERQMDYYRTAGVTHVMSHLEMPGARGSMGPVTWFQEVYPGALEFLYEAGGNYRLYELRSLRR